MMPLPHRCRVLYAAAVGTWLVVEALTRLTFVQRRHRQNRNNRLLWVTSRPIVDTATENEKFSSHPSAERSASQTTSGTSPNIVVSSGLSQVVSKYPTARGSEIDARKIVVASGGRQHVTAIRVQHILLASKDLAAACLESIRSGATSAFDELAQQLSLCTATRNQGGELGWVNVQENFGSHEGAEAKRYSEANNAHLNDLFPQEARDRLLQLTNKPGDVVLIESNLGYHLVQVVDLMTDVRQMVVRKRRSTTYHGGTESRPLGILGGALLHSDTLSVSSKPWDLTYKIETMGCQMNMADSERIEGQLQMLGMRPFLENQELPNKQVDLIVLNTCSIRDHAEHKVYSYIGQYAKRKREGEDVVIVVAGCVAQQEGEALLRRAPEVDLVMGPQYANRISDLLEDVSNGNQVVATEASHIMEDSTKPRRQSTVAAWVNVIYGCNERCTFCIVPTTRGVEQSRPVESIAREVSELVQQGYQEVTLLGQNIDAYGRDMIPKRKFSDLIRTVGTIPGLKRLRFVTSHPRYMSLGVVDAVAETPSVCECFHIPFQSGSNEILTSMGRGYTREKYLQIVDRIRSRLPDAAITADAIVGFPGETEEQFQETLSLMEEVVFDSVNTAAYSPRPNTPAALYENQVEEEIKQERLRQINELNNKHAAMRRARLVGQVVEILVEERNVKLPGQVVGRTRHGYIVYCAGDIDELRGRLVNVEIKSAHHYYLIGAITKTVI